MATTALNIRSFPPELMRKIKSAAALAGKPMREYVIEMLAKEHK